MPKLGTKTYLILLIILSLSIAMFALKMGAQQEKEMRSKIDKLGQVVISEGDSPVLRYNYQIVYETDEFAFNGLDPNEYVKTRDDTFMTNPSIYAVPRSDYIHPLFGLKGEILTRDWSKDHPHHRGIYWAWPEVDYGKKRSDIHALQKVFARPTGRLKVQDADDYAQIEAENLWIMEDDLMPIVIEHAMVRVYSEKDSKRIIDLAFQFEGLRDSVTIARRGMNAYGGLNIRMMTPKSQNISFFTDESGADPQRAWSKLSGVFTGNDEQSGLVVLQNDDNPDYPGDWVEYPELSWVQPTFPSTGTRYELMPGRPLVLRFRLIIYSGQQPDNSALEQFWDDYHKADLAEFDISW